MGFCIADNRLSIPLPHRAKAAAHSGCRNAGSFEQRYAQAISLTPHCIMHFCILQLTQTSQNVHTSEGRAPRRPTPFDDSLQLDLCRATNLHYD